MIREGHYQKVRWIIVQGVFVNMVDALPALWVLPLAKTAASYIFTNQAMLCHPSPHVRILMFRDELMDILA
jgi:hypothetical protein